MENRKLAVILASKSPRRIKLLKSLEISFKTIEANTDETLDKSISVRKNASINAEKKLISALNKIKEKDFFLITADTIVSYRNKPIGKPKNLKEAEKFLNLFSGNIIKVYTAISVFNSAVGKKKTGTETTTIKTAKMNPELIKEILHRISPLERAGGFSIEGIGAIPFDNIKGSFYNVLGFPLNLLYELSLDTGFNILKQNG